jgi:hypothetical protein
MLIGSRVVHDRSAQACAQVLAASRNAAAVSCRCTHIHTRTRTRKHAVVAAAFFFLSLAAFSCFRRDTLPTC